MSLQSQGILNPGRFMSLRMAEHWVRGAGSQAPLPVALRSKSVTLKERVCGGLGLGEFEEVGCVGGQVAVTVWREQGHQ